MTPLLRCAACAKNSYPDMDDARIAAAIQWKYDGIVLWIYPCPRGHGLHLTKNPRPPTPGHGALRTRSQRRQRRDTSRRIHRARSTHPELNEEISMTANSHSPDDAAARQRLEESLNADLQVIDDALHAMFEATREAIAVVAQLRSMRRHDTGASRGDAFASIHRHLQTATAAIGRVALRDEQ